MCAINDRLQEHFPALAADLRAEEADMRLPEGLTLRLALTDEVRSRVGGPVGYMRVLQRREMHMPLAEIWFPPLAWCLTSTRATDPSLGPDFTGGWADASVWIRFSEELETDLRNIAGPLPVTRPPQFGAEDWVILTGDEVMAALEGRPAFAAG
jgi:hypothetical protein